MDRTFIIVIGLTPDGSESLTVLDLDDVKAQSAMDWVEQIMDNRGIKPDEVRGNDVILVEV